MAFMNIIGTVPYKAKKYFRTPASIWNDVFGLFLAEQIVNKGHLVHPFSLWGYHLVMINIAMEEPWNKWRFLAGKIIYFYVPFSTNPWIDPLVN